MMFLKSSYSRTSQQGFVIYGPGPSLTDNERIRSSPQPNMTTSKPEKRFRFIDNSDKASISRNSTQIRRHVMREYMREKRWEERNQLERNQTVMARSRARKSPQKKEKHQHQMAERQSSAATPCQYPHTIIKAKSAPQPRQHLAGQWDSPDLRLQPQPLTKSEKSSSVSFSLGPASFACTKSEPPLHWRCALESGAPQWRLETVAASAHRIS